MAYENEKFRFNFPCGGGEATDAQAVEAIVTAVGELRMETGLFYGDSDKAIDRFDAKACLSAIAVAREAERVISRFPAWMVNGCYAEALRGAEMEHAPERFAMRNLDDILAAVDGEERPC